MLVRKNVEYAFFAGASRGSLKDGVRSSGAPARSSVVTLTALRRVPPDTVPAFAAYEFSQPTRGRSVQIVGAPRLPRNDPGLRFWFEPLFHSNSIESRLRCCSSLSLASLATEIGNTKNPASAGLVAYVPTREAQL
jgi:hypothetical protein